MNNKREKKKITATTKQKTKHLREFHQAPSSVSAKVAWQECF
jgi:hypothetical protein